MCIEYLQGKYFVRAVSNVDSRYIITLDKFWSNDYCTLLFENKCNQRISHWKAVLLYPGYVHGRCCLYKSVFTVSKADESCCLTSGIPLGALESIATVVAPPSDYLEWPHCPHCFRAVHLCSVEPGSCTCPLLLTAWVTVASVRNQCGRNRRQPETPSNTLLASVLSRMSWECLSPYNNERNLVQGALIQLIVHRTSFPQFIQPTLSPQILFLPAYLLFVWWSMICA